MAEESYSEQNLSMIQYDCQQTAPCDSEFSLRADSVAECIKDTSMKLDTGSDGFRASYEQRFRRCSGNTGCQYFFCASDNMLFSVVHEMQLRNECQQRTFCAIQSGKPTAANEMDMCFMQLANQLDFASIPDKSSWEQRWGRCTGRMSCEYVNCQ
ncbi:MAG TPA: hypothetical protein VJR89_08500 [Polyangiales bacterium]|nr:hypothetical protein [Polyangiales bacterium]